MHYSRLHSFIHFLAQFLDRPHATLLLPVFRPPDRQRYAPVARAAEVPVLQIFEPFAEAAFAGGGGLPVDGLVQFHHPVFGLRGGDEPGIQRIVQDGLVRSPAVRIGVDVFLHVKGVAFGLQFDGNVHVHGLVVCLIFIVLDVAAREFAHLIGELALPVHQRQRANAMLAGDLHVVGAKGRRGVHHARAIFSGHEVAGDDLEGITVGGLSIGQELFVADAEELFPLERDGLFQDFGLVLAAEPLADQCLRQHHAHVGLGVGIMGFYLHVGNVRAHRQGRIGRQRPGRGGPGQDAQVLVLPVVQKLGVDIARHFEHGDDGRVGHVLISAGLVEFMGTEAGTGRRAVGLDGVAFVQIAFIVEALEQVPHRLDVAVLEGDVRIIEVDPVAHFAGDIVPDILVAHHRTAAGGIIGLHRDFFADVFLGDTEFLLHGEFDR